MAKYQYAKIAVGHPIFAGAFFASILIYSIVAFGGKIEGKLFPVALADSIRISEIDPALLIDGTRLEGTMVKLRNCDFIGLQASILNPVGTKIVVPMDVRESIKLREKGEHEWGPWRVLLPVWQVEPQIEIIVFHQCNPFYITETEFYNSYEGVYKHPNAETRLDRK